MTENHKLENCTCIEQGTNFAFVLNSKELFSPTEYKVMQSQSGDELVRCMKMTYNGKTELYYLREGRYSLLDILPSIRIDTIMIIINTLLKTVISIKNNGFLTCCNIDLSPEHIFIDAASGKAYLSYLPLNKSIYTNYQEFDTELRQMIVGCLSANSNLKSPQMSNLKDDLRNMSVPIEQIFIKLGGKLESQPVVKNVEKRSLRLNYLGPENIVFNIDKDNYLIGKDPAKADGLIEFNKYVGRTHCTINKVEGNYFVTDLDSTNHTYLNDKMLPANKAYPIVNGDRLRLANAEFRVEVYISGDKS